MSGHQYISNPSDLFEDDIDDETFLKNSRQNNHPSDPYANQAQMYEQRKKEIEERTLTSTHRSLGLLHDTEQVGVATAEELAKQREQLENTSKQLDDINSTLRFSQKHLNGLKSVFGGLKNYLSGQKNMEPAPSTGRSNSSAKINEIPTAKEKPSYESHPVSRLRGHDSDGYGYGQQTTSKSSSFQDQLDRNLDDMGSSLSRLKGLAIDLHQEIDEQNDLIDNITYKVEDVDLKIGRQNRDMNKLLGKK